jgi:LysM repeat protein
MLRSGLLDFYTTVSGDTLARVAAAYKLSETKVAEFNRLPPGASLTPGTKLRLIPDGPTNGAKGAATTDANGIPTSYVIEPGDTLDGISYRFNLTEKQLAEANKVPFTYEKGGIYFIHAGNRIQLQKNPVDSRSGTGNDGIPLTYTTAPGDIERQVAFRFGVPEIADLESANRPSTGGDRVWYQFSDLPNGGLAPGQTISLSREKPINKPASASR